ncbi:hypothetical protein EDC01DRAFT_212884 [Geopyxis carbonaria]|nr:hypothetical protein EDC01DRAFT_212884 [Geopyxis carbonaria]
MATDTPDLSQLTDREREALHQYTSVTAQDVALAVPLLRRSQWSVEIAIAKFFDGETADPVAEAQAAATAAAAARPAPPRIPTPAERRVAALLTPAPRIVPQPDAVARRPPLLVAILLFPFSLVWRLSGLLSKLFPFLPRFARPSPHVTPTRRSQSPRDTAARFIRAFEEEHGPATETGLNFYEGGYAQALDLAKAELRFLLVILQSPEHDDTAAFNATTLASPELSQFLREHNVLLWAGSVADSEPYQVAAALGCTKFPFAALITHAANTPPGASSQGMSVVARLVGPTPAPAFVAKLRAAVATHEPALAAIRANRVAQQADRAIREEQNSAYELSLARDRQRAQERRAAEERERAEAAAAAKAAAEAEELARKRSAWRRWRKATLLQEPAAEAEVARVSVRTADGERVVRRFGKEVGMEEVYAFVETLDMDDEEVGGERPEGYEHEYRFRLASVMPRKEYAPDAGTVGEYLWPSGNLVVEMVGDDEDEEGEEA